MTGPRPATSTEATAHIALTGAVREHAVARMPDPGAHADERDDTPTTYTGRHRREGQT